MNPNSDLQARMSHELENKSLLNKARSYAFSYLDQAPDRHVFPTLQALENLQHFEESMPVNGTDAEGVLELLHLYGSPATVSQIAGRYYGFVNGSIIPAALAAKWLADVWDQNAAMEVMSPVTAKLETIVEKWLEEMFGFPEDTAAGFVSGTSVAIFSALLAARYRLLKNLGWDVNAQGLYGAPRIRIIAGKQIHSAQIRALTSLGFGRDSIEWVEVDEQGRMIAGDLPELDEHSLVLLQAGNVNSGSFDPFEEVCKKARAAGAWVHIDGAFGLWAGAVEHFRNLTKGMELADSWSVDGHKTLNTPYDSGIVLCRDREALVMSLQSHGAYLTYGEKRDGMKYTPSMSRRARIIELWASLKYLGKTGVAEMIVGMHERAKQFEQGLAVVGFEILNDVVFNQVMIRCESDSLTDTTLKHLQELRTCWCGSSEWFGQKVIRISVCSWATTEEDVKKSVASFVEARKMAMASRIV